MFSFETKRLLFQEWRQTFYVSKGLTLEDTVYTRYCKDVHVRVWGWGSRINGVRLQRREEFEIDRVQ